MKRRNALGTLSAISGFDSPTWFMFWDRLVNFLRTNITIVGNAVPRSPTLKALVCSFIEGGHGDQFWGVHSTHDWKLNDVATKPAINSFLERCILTAKAIADLNRLPPSPQRLAPVPPPITLIASHDQWDTYVALPANRNLLTFLTNALSQPELKAEWEVGSLILNESVTIDLFSEECERDWEQAMDALGDGKMFVFLEVISE